MTAAPRLSDEDCAAIHAAADAAAVAAAEAVTPHVRTIPANGDVPARIISSDHYLLGWAHVFVMPAGSRFARWLLQQFGDVPRDSPYRAEGPRSDRPGLQLRVSAGPEGHRRFHPSTERLRVAAHAYADELRKRGIRAVSDWSDGMN